MVRWGTGGRFRKSIHVGIAYNVVITSVLFLLPVKGWGPFTCKGIAGKTQPHFITCSIKDFTVMAQERNIGTGAWHPNKCQ